MGLEVGLPRWVTGRERGKQGVTSEWKRENEWRRFYAIVNDIERERERETEFVCEEGRYNEKCKGKRERGECVR